MKKSTRKLVNSLMTAALIIVVVSGTLLYRMGASMWLGITHGVSGYVLLILALIHLLSHRKRA